MTRVLLSIGANSQQASANVVATLRWLADGADGVLSDVEVVEPYTTPEVSGRFPDYVNAVATANTDLSLDELTAIFKSCERAMGRTAQSKTTGIVPIDIDVVTFGDTVVRPNELSRSYITIGLSRLKS